MLLSDFRFRDKFVGLSDDDLQLLLDEAEVAWAGVRTLWGKLNEPVRTQKRDLCMNYISAWYIADLNPRALVGGVFSTGGTPLSSKSIDGVAVAYKGRTVPNGMDQFLSNGFGIKALDMLVNSPDMFLVHGY